MSRILFELRLILKNSAFLILLISYFIILLLATSFGINRYQHEIKQIEQSASYFTENKSAWKNKDSLSPGMAAYYIFEPAVFTPSLWSALFHGERKEQLTQQRIRILSIHSQIYGNPVTNKTHLSIGRLDASFIWLYLMPLVIGLISVTCIADERRLERWPLISSVTESRARFILYRLSARFLLILLFNSLTLVIASISLSIPLNQTSIYIFGILFLYQLFWFLVSGIVIVLNKNAVQSLLLFISFWLISVFVIPGIYYLQKLESQSVNTGIELLMTQRQLMNDSWDNDQQSDFNQFIAKHPQWKNQSRTIKPGDWDWYYAMQKESDNKVSQLANTYHEQQLNTQSIWLWLSPTLTIQNELETIASTSSRSYIHYRQQIIQWHQQLQNFWFPYLFLDKPFQPQDLDNVPPFNYQNSYQGSNVALIYFFLLNLAILFIAARWYKIRYFYDVMPSIDNPLSKKLSLATNRVK
ncbi:DUF3526 domain-containing protein [Aliikangiella maris]|uniref:DUF3526 domain-containing protein n=2 Tax=Aliikangiella maris TaxID=3162458 RepID=A0ABV2BZC3_9GAMM